MNKQNMNLHPDEVIKFLKRAVAISKQNIENQTGGPFGAIVVKEGQIISEAGNEVTSTNDPTAHAEVVAIRKACKALNTFQLTGCVLFTSCEPCPMCLGAIYWARPDKVYFANTRQDAAAIGFDDEFIYNEIPVDPPFRKIPMHHVPMPEASEVFALWKSIENKITY